MAITVVPPQQQQNQGSENLMSVMNSINQRRKEVEEQQRSMEYEFINNYAASHGGFAGLSAMPGGEEMLSHYATNVLGYSSDLVPGMIDAVQKGYNPDEALYQIRNQAMFARTQEQEQPPTPEPEPKAEKPTEIKTSGAAIANAIDPYTKEVQTGIPGSTTTRKYSPQVETTDQMGGISGIQGGEVKAAAEGQLSEEQQARQYNTEQKRAEAQRDREGGMETRLDIIKEGEDANVDQVVGAVLKQTSVFPNNKIPYFDRKTAKTALGDKEGATTPIMNEKQRKLYLATKEYVNLTQATTTTEFLTGLKGVFNTVGKSETFTGSGKDAAAMKQVERKAITAFNRLPNIKDYAQLSPERAMQYIDRINQIQVDDPQRWAETYQQAFNTKQKVTEMDYKKALTDLVKIQAGAQQMDILLKQQQMENPETAEAASAIQLLQLFMSEPALADNPAFEKAAQAAGGIIFQLFGNMLDPDGKIKVSLKQNPLTFWNFWKSPENRGITVQTLIGEADNTNGTVHDDIAGDY